LLASYVTGLVAMVAISAGWLGVQRAWQRAFPDASGDSDALAGRMGCHGCGCADACERRPPDACGPEEEKQS
jgi:hypothetical protein